MDPGGDPLAAISTRLDSSFVYLPDDSTASNSDSSFKLYVTILEGDLPKESSAYVCVGLNKELPKATRVLSGTRNPSWSQTFVYSLGENLHEQALFLQLFEMDMTSTNSHKTGSKKLSLDSFLSHHNDIVWIELDGAGKILLGFCFEEYDLIKELIRQNLPLRRAPESFKVYPLLEGEPTQGAPLLEQPQVIEQLQSSLVDDLRRSAERDIGAEFAAPIVTDLMKAAQPPPLPPRAAVVASPPPPLPPRSGVIPATLPRLRINVDWEKISDEWFKKHARDTDPDNITLRFDDLFDEFRDSKDHASIVRRMIGDEAPNLICLFVPGLYTGRMPFKVRQDMNVVWGRRMGELQAMGLDARVIQVPVDGPVLLNATIIGTLMQDLRRQFPEKKFVMVGYSKGGVDISAALAVMPELQPFVRCLITMFSPLYGSHIATDLNGSMASITQLAVQSFMGLDPEAMRDLTIPARKLFLAKYPIPTTIPIINLTSAILESSSALKFLYQYIKSRHGKESDGVVACSDAVVPGAKRIILLETDHKGAHEGNRRYRDQVLLLGSLICCSVEVTRSRVAPSGPAPQLPPRSHLGSASPPSSSLYPSLE